MRYYWLLLPTILLALYGCVGPQPKTVTSTINEQVSITLNNPTKQFLSGGQPSEDDLRVLASHGTKHIINLRTIDEPVSFNEKRLVNELGMTYHRLPVNGAKGITKNNAQQLDSLLASVGDDPAFVHCASGNRVGALIAIRAHFIQGASLEDAIDKGKRWGLTGLEETVRQQIKQ